MVGGSLTVYGSENFGAWKFVVGVLQPIALVHALHLVVAPGWHMTALSYTIMLAAVAALIGCWTPRRSSKPALIRPYCTPGGGRASPSRWRSSRLQGVGIIERGRLTLRLEQEHELLA